MTVLAPAEHPTWHVLSAEQRQAINEVWDETVIPALEHAEQARRDRDAALLAAQDARDAARLAREDAGRRADRDREKRQALLSRVAELEARLP